MAAIETSKLVKRFGKFTAVDALDLTIEDGETYGLLGPNGSGKTTAIKMICGLLEPTSGSVKVLGRTMPSIGYDSTTFEFPRTTAKRAKRGQAKRGHSTSSTPSIEDG